MVTKHKRRTQRQSKFERPTAGEPIDLSVTAPSSYTCCVFKRCRAYHNSETIGAGWDAGEKGTRAGGRGEGGVAALHQMIDSLSNQPAFQSFRV